MSKYPQTTVLVCLFTVLLPCVSTAQYCNTTSIPASTPTSQFIDHNNGTVTDKKTGLMWKKCSEGQIWDKGTGGCKDFAAFYNWQDALNSAITLNNRGGFAGKNDWRVPNIKELASIVEQQCLYPSINLTVFPATTSDTSFCSSSPSAFNGDSVWYVFFYYGYVDWGYEGYGYYQVRLVRSGQ